MDKQKEITRRAGFPDGLVGTLAVSDELKRVVSIREIELVLQHHLEGRWGAVHSACVERNELLRDSGPTYSVWAAQRTFEPYVLTLTAGKGPDAIQAVEACLLIEVDSAIAELVVQGKQPDEKVSVQ